MRRLTRRIGLFGGPGAVMPAMGVSTKAAKPEEKKAVTQAADRPAGEKKPSWLRRFWGSKPD